MNEPDIAPLARRLAEENNVDWRRLQGSGEGGRVVERDVLTFLARVMAGEEELDPTPEPVPDGMAAWPEDDVAAYRAGPPSGDERSTTATLDDDDLFLFDDEPDPGSDTASSDAVGRNGDPIAATEPADDDGGLLVVDEDPVPSEASDDADGMSAPYRAGDGADDRPWHTGGGEAPAPDLLFDVDDLQPRATANHPSDRQFDELPDVFGGSFHDEDADDGVLFLDADDDDAREGVPRPLDEPAPERVDAEDPLDVPFESDPGVDGPVTTGLPTEPFAVPNEMHGSEGVTAAASLSTVGALVAHGVPLVRHGQLWRRRFDDRPFRAAVSQIAHALNVAPASVAEVLLARAARTSWSVEDVDAWRWTSSGPQRRPIHDEDALREALRAVDADDRNDARRDAGLAVADLSGIDLDEAVVHLDVPLLAVGRAAADGAWLTLSGDEVPAEAVEALASVAAALKTPIGLLL